MDCIYAILAAVLLAFEFIFSKKYQTVEGVSIAAGLRFNALSGLISAAFMWVISGFRLAYSGYSLILAFGMSLCGSVYVLLGFQILKNGGVALYSTFLMSGGMLLPYVFGFLFLGEKLTLLRIFGVLAVLAGVILSAAGPNKRNKTLLLLCFAVFFLNGFVSILSKCHQITTSHPTVDTASFTVYSGVGKFLFSTAAMICGNQKQPPLQKKTSLFLIGGASVIGGVSYFLQLISAQTLPATVLYPTVTGGGIICSAIAGSIFYREPLSRQQLLSITFCFAGTLLLL